LTRLSATLDGALRKRSCPIIALLALSILAPLVVLDYAVGPTFSLTASYTLPVVLVAWYGRREDWTAAMAGLAAALSLVVRLSASTADIGRFPAWDALGSLGLYLLFGYTILRLRVALDRQRELARTDPLTGLANLRALKEAAEAEVERARRFHHPLTVLFLDIDDFKTVNDAKGHGAGDAVLRDAAAVLRAAVRSTDLVARSGGDEFVVLMPETSSNTARPVLRRLDEALPLSKGELTVSVSMGVATFSRAPASSRELLETADFLMYQAKSEGLGSVQAVLA
jgi:diguanylate cyclase (GGDEF)-like protein